MPVSRASTPWVSAGRLARKESCIVAPSFEAKVGLQTLAIFDGGTKYDAHFQFHAK